MAVISLIVLSFLWVICMFSEEIVMLWKSRWVRFLSRKKSKDFVVPGVS